MAWNQVKQAKRKLSREQGTVFKDWGGRISIALIYPNSYYLGMSNLGLQTIYRLLNSRDQIVCERVFYDESARTPQEPLSLESQRPLSDFDVLAFSISYELDYLNVVAMLKASGIPLLATERDERHPLVIGGGPCIMANPEPLALFFDGFAIGEAEPILPRFLEVLGDFLPGGRDDLLEALSRVPGICTPHANEAQPVVRQWVRGLDDFATASVVLTPDTELGDMYLIEIARGCGRGCRFCLAGYLFRPFRPRSADKVSLQAAEGLRSKKRLGLVGAAVSDHPQLEELVAELRSMGAEISVSSLRIEPLADTLLKAVAESGTRTITLAPEAGSERLRRLINKGIAEDDILTSVEKVAKSGLRQLKLYFMVGLPTETDEDIGDIVRLSVASKELLTRQQAGIQLVVNVTPFVPKAGTPFQWLPMASANVLGRRLSSLKRGLSGKGIEVKTESVAWSIVQAVLARGDRRIGAAVARMKENSLAAWRQALVDCDLDPDFYAHREIPFSETLPWCRIDSGVDPSYLREELARMQQGVTTPPCPRSECQRCGVCQSWILSGTSRS